MTWGGDIRNMYPETVESCWIYCINFIQFLGTPSRKHQFGKRKLEETPTDSSTLFVSLPAVGKSSNSKPNNKKLVQFPTLASLVCYPLVNVYITMEIHHLSYVNPPFQWPFCYFLACHRCRRSVFPSKSFVWASSGRSGRRVDDRWIKNKKPQMGHPAWIVCAGLSTVLIFWVCPSLVTCHYFLGDQSGNNLSHTSTLR